MWESDVDLLKITSFISDVEKFNVLKEVYPNRYFNRNICAKYIGAGRQIFRTEEELNPIKSDIDKEEKKRIIDAIGFIVESNLDIFMKKMARDEELREKFKDNEKLFSKEIRDASEKLVSNHLKSLNIDISLLNPYIKEVVRKVFNKGSQTVNTWEKNETKSIPKSEIKKNLARMFGMRYEIWGKDYKDIQSFKQELEIFQKPIDKEEENPLDKKILGEIVPLSLAEENEYEFISQVKPIQIPANLVTFSANFIYRLAHLLKDNEQVSDALYVLEVLERKIEPFIFYYRKEIQHLKAILLSHKDIQRWNDAIIQLRYLYADGYHFKNPEILTLLASNYKRKALYHPNGTLNYKEQVDINLLQQANDLYEDAYELSEEDKYYPAINRAYLMLIIDAIEGNRERTKIEQEIGRIYTELVKNGFPSNSKDWWQITTQVEFLVLMKRDGEALDILENYQGSITKFDIETTIRQLEIYSHFTNEEIGRDLIGFLQEYIEK